MKNELVVLDKTNIEDLIFEVRDKLVILDSDLSKIYGYSNGTKTINLNVKRHRELFSEEIAFQLNNDEVDNLRFLAETSSLYGGRRYNPYVFTLEGIKILSTISKKPNVLNVTLEIEEAFKKLKNKNDRSLAIPVSKGENIRDLIYELDGKQVMLDFDLARIYECKNGTKEINQAVKNNLDKFPLSYSWILSDDELVILRSKVLTFDHLTKINNRKYKIRVFTESGTWMLSTILKTEIASKITRKIIDAFVMMRKYIDTNILEQRSINEQVLNNTQNIIENTKEINQNRKDIELYKNKLDKQGRRLHKTEEDIELLKNEVFKFDTNKNDNLLFLDGQIYDAYSKILDIWSEAKKELIIVDGYADKKVLDMISNLKVEVILIVKDKANLKDRDIEEYNKQYSNLTVIRDNSSHDRYFILDRTVIYHSGASINHAGKGMFSITHMTDEITYLPLLRKIEAIINEQMKSSGII